MWNSRGLSDERPAHQRPSKVLWILVAAMITTGIWAYIYKIDQVVRGSGAFIATSRVQVVQAVDGGVITALKVKEGNRVEQGQVVAMLDQTRFAAAVKELDGRLAALSARSARLRAELSGADTVQFSQSVEKFPALVNAERSLFRQRTISFHEDMRTAQVAVNLAAEDARLVSALAKNGDVSRAEVIRVERALNDAEAQMINRKNKYFQDAQTELAKVEDDTVQNEQIRAQRLQQLEDTVLRAAVPGVVKNMRLTTAGSVLRAGEELMQIVPVDEQLMVEVKIKPADISQLQVGLPANIRVDSFDYTVFGAVSGTVSYISADTLKEDTRAGEQVYYRVHIVTKGGPVVTQSGKQIDILPGMTAQVDIRTGERTVLEYILKPLRKTMTESLGER